MTPPADPERYKHHRFPGEIISHGVWLYYRFSLSYRDVEEILFERGITVTHEAIRQWCLKFGQDYANQLRHRRPQPGDKWHLEIVFTQLIKTRGLATGSRRDDVPNLYVTVVN
jgi:putative transposase